MTTLVIVEGPSSIQAVVFTWYGVYFATLVGSTQGTERIYATTRAIRKSFNASADA